MSHGITVRLGWNKCGTWVRWLFVRRVTAEMQEKKVLIGSYATTGDLGNPQASELNSIEVNLTNLDRVYN